MDRILKYEQSTQDPEVPRNPRTDIQVACIVSSELYHALSHEVRPIIITRDNILDVAEFGEQQAFLFESCISDVTRQWTIRDWLNSEFSELMRMFVDHCRRRSIPTIFWKTQGPEYDHFYFEYDGMFDVVYATSSDEEESKRRGRVDEVLESAIHPSCVSPLTKPGATRSGVVADCWALLLRQPDFCSLFRPLQSLGLNIIESHAEVFASRREELGDLSVCLSGCVGSASKLSIYRRSLAGIVLSAGLTTKSQLRRDLLEMAASKCVPLANFRDPNCIEFDGFDELERICLAYTADPMLAQREAQVRWRGVYLNHTIPQRLNRLLGDCGAGYWWEETPTATIVVPSIRPERIPDIVGVYDSQTWPAKELVIVVNLSELQLDSIGSMLRRRDIRIVSVPPDTFAGGALAVGFGAAQGEYCFRMDDDDLYGPNYILDLMLYARCLPIDLIAKPPSPIRIDDAEGVWVRDTDKAEVLLLPAGSTDLRGLGGNSMGGRTSILRKMDLAMRCFGNADTAIYSRAADVVNTVLVSDRFNLVAHRRTTDTHTSRVDIQRVCDAVQNSDLVARDFIV